MKKRFIIGVIGLGALITTYLWLSKINRHSINQTTMTCLVTGASSGIGYEVSREMIKRGWKVIGIARREEKLKEIGHEFGENFIPYVCDVAKRDQVHIVSEAIKTRGLKPILFFLNAGIGVVLEKFQPMFQEQQQTFTTNYFGVISWVDEWLTELKKYRGGTFVATSSVSSLFAGLDTSGYGASKVALNASFKAFRLQYYYDHINFVLVLPGPVATTMLKVPKPMLFTQQPKDTAKYIVSQVFLGKNQVEPSWFYSCLLRILNLLPDWLVLKII